MGNFSDFFKEIASSNAGHFTFPVQNKHIPCPLPKKLNFDIFCLFLH